MESYLPHAVMRGRGDACRRGVSSDRARHLRRAVFRRGSNREGDLEAAPLSPEMSYIHFLLFLPIFFQSSQSSPCSLSSSSIDPAQCARKKLYRGQGRERGKDAGKEDDRCSVVSSIWKREGRRKSNLLSGCALNSVTFTCACVRGSELTVA